MRHVISLNDSDWFIGAVPPQPFGATNDFGLVDGWIPATVPGDVRLELLRINKIPDPFLAEIVKRANGSTSTIGGIAARFI